MITVVDLPIYTFHIDYAGHVSNIVYIQWLEIGRTCLLRKAGLPIAYLEEQGIVPVLARTTISYRAPLYLGDRATLEMWIDELGRASATLAFCIHKERETLVAEGTQKGLFVHRDTMRPARMTREMQERFAAFAAG